MLIPYTTPNRARNPSPPSNQVQNTHIRCAQIMRLCITMPQDFERERNPERVLQSMSLKRFAALIFRECPGLAPFAGSLDKIHRAFAEYKQVSGRC